jgi:hypothetical protein
VPEPVGGVDLEARIAALIEARRPELEQLVDAALDRELEAMIMARITSLNGQADLIAPGANNSKADYVMVKVCTGACGRTLPLTAFEKGRGKCRECRRAEQRARGHDHEQTDSEPPRTLA